MTLSLTFILLAIVGVLIWSKKHHTMPVVFGVAAYLLGLFTATSPIGQGIAAGVQRVFGGH